MEETCFLVAAAVDGDSGFAERLRRAAAAHGGEVDGTIGDAAVAVFAAPEGAVGCMNALDPSSARMILHSAPLSSRAEAIHSEAVVRAAAALGRVEVGAPVVSTVFKARLPPSHQARFARHVLVEGWLPGWTFAAPFRAAPAPAPSRTVAPATPSATPSDAEEEPGVGEMFMRTVRHALDQVDRSLTRSPDHTSLLGTFARAGSPLSVAEVADEHHLTLGRTKDLLKKATKRGYLERLPDDTYILISDEERLRRWVRKKRRKLREHLNSYLIVNTGLFVINLATSALVPPWFLFVAMGWGLGLALDWQKTNRQIRDAVGDDTPLLGAPLRVGPPEALPAAEPTAVREPELPAPWGEVEGNARGLLGQLRSHLAPIQSAEVTDPEEMLAGYRATVHQLAVQGARIDGVLARFTRERLVRELADAQERIEALEREGDARLATTHLDRARLLQDQIRMIDGLNRQREAALLKLKNVITTLENLLLDLSRGALRADEDQVDSVLESGTRDLARYRDWLAEANEEIDRLLR